MDDLEILFEDQRDPDAVRMAAFLSRDKDAFMAHWKKILTDPAITKKTILFEGFVAGNIVCFKGFGKPHIGCRLVRYPGEMWL